MPLDAIPYLLIVFALDVSGSMQGEGVRHLTEAMDKLIASGKSQDNADHILFGLILFSDHIVLRVPPTPIRKFQMPAINADGCTDLGMAVMESMAMAQQWKDEMASDFNKKRWCPNLIICSDGAPYLGDKSGRDPVAEYTRIASEAREASVTKAQSKDDADQHHFYFVPIACGNANRELLKLLRADQSILDVHSGEGLKDAFALLGGSISQVSEQSADADIVIYAQKSTAADRMTDPDDIGEEIFRCFDFMSQL